MPKGISIWFLQKLRLYIRLLSLRKAVLLRFFLCWLSGLAFLLFDETHDYDRRLQMRPSQTRSDQIVLLILNESDLSPTLSLRSKSPTDWDLGNFGQDDSYWNQKIWDRALGALLRGEPRAIGITLNYVESNLGLQPPIGTSSPIQDPKVFWSVKLPNDDRPKVPGFIEQNQQIVSHSFFPMDSDGTVRRFHDNMTSFRHLASNLAQMMTEGKANRYSPHQVGSFIINFRGDEGTFRRYRLDRLIRGDYSPTVFRDKIIIVGIEGSDRHLLRTPLGLMSRAELTANIVDNISNQRFVWRANLIVNSIGLLIILLISAYIIFSYPQSVAFVFLFWFGTGLTALSFFLFDCFYFWTPIVSPLIQLLVTYMVFLTHLVNTKETRAWKLEQERRYFQQIEELKTNFVSLISHDLKTPIAKLQALVDRQLPRADRVDLAEDLKGIRRESQELNRYIQSILKMTQVESDEIKLRPESTDFNFLVEDVVENLTTLAQLKQIQLRTDLDPIFLIEADGVLIQEVILNLIENAIKYAREGSVVKIRSFEENGIVNFSVSDEGPGIASDDLPFVFQKFYRGVGAHSTQKGSGLGLYLVKYFIELHGGTVFLTSTPEKGTVVGFRLPTGETQIPTHTGPNLVAQRGTLI